MSRYTGPAFKKSRRVGFSTLETGKDMAKRPYAPGQHGRSRRAKVTEYGLQLTEKQKVRFAYGLNERQFFRTFKDAQKMDGIHGENLLKILESRLDNVVFRMGMGATRRASRQLVNHGHILVDGKKVDIPSYRVEPGSKISLKHDMKSVRESLDRLVSRVEYVNFDNEKLEGTFLRYPERSELSSEINEALIVEYYNR